MPLGTQELIEAVEDYEAAGIWPDEEQMVAATQCDQFQIATKDQAAWALRKMSKIQAEVNENALAADIEIKRIMDWRISENAKLQGSLNFFEYLLMGYFQEQRKADPSLKTVKLPHGILKMRAQQAEFAYDDEVLLPWAKEHLPAAVVVKESVAKNRLKDWLRETGELPDGVTITDRPDKFSVEVI
jgi:hypothetical protein